MKPPGGEGNRVAPKEDRLEIEDSAPYAKTRPGPTRRQRLVHSEFSLSSLVLFTEVTLFLKLPGSIPPTTSAPFWWSFSFPHRVV